MLPRLLAERRPTSTQEACDQQTPKEPTQNHACTEEIRYLNIWDQAAVFGQSAVGSFTLPPQMAVITPSLLWRDAHLMTTKKYRKQHILEQLIS